MKRDEILMKLFSEDSKPFALEDVFVVEIAEENFAAAIAGSLLAEMGAKVLRVEFSDEAKNISPFGVKIGGVGIPYFVESRNKEIMKFSDEIREKIFSADVIIDGTLPGYLDSIGIGYRQISKKNPKAIYVAISPFGHFTLKAKEFKNVPDSDLTAQAYNGYPTLIGNPYLTGERSYPLRAGLWAAWAMAGVNAAVGAMIALLERLRSGKGQFVDVATNDALAVVTTFPAVMGFLFDKPRGRFGTIDYLFYPFGYHRAKDGYIALATPTDADFRALLKILKRWDLEPDWKFTLDRISDDLERIRVLDEELNKTLQNFTIRDLLKRSAKMRKSRLPFFGKFLGRPVIVKINTLKEVLQDEHWKVRRSFLKVKLNGKEAVIPNSPIKASETPPRVKKMLGKEVTD
ncbi:MAG: CoA transferase [Archaeoglobaceae archaeon]